MHLWYVSRSGIKNDNGEGNITLTWVKWVAWVTSDMDHVMHGSHDTCATWYMQYSIFFAYIWQSLFLKTNVSYDYVTYAGEQNGLYITFV